MTVTSPPFQTSFSSDDEKLIYISIYEECVKVCVFIAFPVCFITLHYWLIQCNADWAVVAAHLAGVDAGAGDARGDCRRG